MNQPATPAATTQGEDILAYLEHTITTTEQAAHAAAATDPAPWTADAGIGSTNDHDRAAGSGLLFNAAGEPLWDCEQSDTLCMTAAASIHAALHDPESVLRRCTADRKLIAEHGPWSAADLSCKGCGLNSHEEMVTGYYEDCPVLCALAEGYGRTESER